MMLDIPGAAGFVALAQRAVIKHEGKEDFAAVAAPDVRDHEHGSCWIAAIVHKEYRLQYRTGCAWRLKGGAW